MDMAIEITLTAAGYIAFGLLFGLIALVRGKESRDLFNVVFLWPVVTIMVLLNLGYAVGKRRILKAWRHETGLTSTSPVAAAAASANSGSANGCTRFGYALHYCSNGRQTDYFQIPALQQASPSSHGHDSVITTKVPTNVPR